MTRARRIAVLVALSIALVVGAVGPALAGAADDTGSSTLAQNRERW